MGLNEVYIVVRGNILMINPLPSMAQAFSLLIQEEKQKEFKFAGKMSMDSTSLTVNAVNNFSKNMIRPFKTNYKTNGYPRVNNNTWNKLYAGNNSNRNTLVYDFCKKIAHIKDKYFKLHRFLHYNNQNHKSTNYNNGQGNIRQNSQDFKGKKVMENVHGNPSNIVPNYGDVQTQIGNGQGVGITKEQYGQIMSLVQQIQMENSSENQNGSHVNPCSMSFTGPFSEENSGDW